MECVWGETRSQQMAEGALPLPKAAPVLSKNPLFFLSAHTRHSFEVEQCVNADSASGGRY